MTCKRSPSGWVTLAITAFGLLLMTGACTLSTDDHRPPAAQEVLDTGKASYDLTEPSTITREEVGMEPDRLSMGLDVMDADAPHFDTIVRLPDQAVVHELIDQIGWFSHGRSSPQQVLSLQARQTTEEAHAAADRLAQDVDFPAAQAERVSRTIDDAARTSDAATDEVQDAFMVGTLGDVEVSFEVRTYSGPKPVAVIYRFEW